MDQSSDSTGAPSTAPQVRLGEARFGAGHGGKRINLVKLARAQRQLLWCVLARIGMEVGSMAIFGSPGSLGAPIIAAYVLSSLVLMVVTIVFIVRMALAYGVHPALGVLGGIAIVIPCAGLLLLLLLNQRVTVTLQRAGVKVGLMGIGRADEEKLRLGTCPSCGYDLRGLMSGSVCPECGTMAPVV